MLLFQCSSRFCFSFMYQFQITANYIEDTLHHQIHSLFESNRELSRYVTLSGINSVRKNGDNDFPYVAVPSFEVQAHTTRYDSGGGIDVLFYAPIVSNFTKWVQFTNETKHWLEESKYLYDKMEPGNNRSNETPRMYLPPVVYKFDNVTGQHIVPWFGTPSDQVDDNTDTFCPRLYTSPPPYMGDGIVQNEDLFSNRKYKSMSDASIQLQGKVIFVCSAEA